MSFTLEDTFQSCIPSSPIDEPTIETHFVCFECGYITANENKSPYPVVGFALCLKCGGGEKSDSS